MSPRNRSGRSRMLALWPAMAAMLAAVLLVAPGAASGAKKKHVPSATARGRGTPQRADKSTSATAVAPPRRAAGSPTSKADVGERAPGADADVVVVAPSAETPASGDGAAAPTGGTKSAKTKVYTFGAMDVEGKLKTPQLLYFLNRVKLELEMSAPDQRSFMKELARTADDPNL